MTTSFRRSVDVVSKESAGLAFLARCVAVCAVAFAVFGHQAVAETATRLPALFYLNLRGEVRRLDDEKATPIVLVSKPDAGVGPDGIAVDAKSGFIYWSTMGKPSADDGAIMRANLDGTQVTAIVPVGGTFTPKQTKLDLTHKKIYWSDREGMRVMRANLDGSNVETLVITGTGDEDRKDASRWCVGIAIDAERGYVYWTQKGADNAGQGTIKRAHLELPAGADPARRSDVETLLDHLPEPIDLELDLHKRQIYWTDRGDNTISRAPMDKPRVADRHILVRGLHEVIGITLDTAHNRMYYTSLGGEIGVARLDGSSAKLLQTGQGPLTGIALAPLP